MQTVNLCDIFESIVIPAIYTQSPDIVYNATIEAMRESCRQILELAAENAVELIDDTNGCRECGVNGVNKQSILDTINQIE